MYRPPLFLPTPGDLALSLPAGEVEVASVDSLTDLICQAITLGMCYGGFAKQRYSMK